MNPTDNSADLLKEAQTYVHTPVSYTALEPHKLSILTLRAKYASYEIIVEMLSKHDIKVSESTLRRFCRRYNKEMREIRQQMQPQKGEIKGDGKPSAPQQATLTDESNQAASNVHGKA